MKKIKLLKQNKMRYNKKIILIMGQIIFKRVINMNSRSMKVNFLD